MGKCLITRLQGFINNPAVTKIGELRIDIKKSNSKNVHQIILRANKNINVEIIGDGHFTDSTGAENKGQTALITSTNTTLYINNSDCQLSVPNKYSLYNISLLSSDCSLSISDLKYITGLQQINSQYSKTNGDIAFLQNDILNIYLSGSEVFGDIASLAKSTKISVLSINDIDGVYGDIAVLKDMVNAAIIQLNKTGVYGDISNLSNCTELKTLNLYNTKKKVTGDIGSLKNTALKTLDIQNAQLTGDLATLPGTCILASLFNNGDSSFTWSTRPSSASIISIQGMPKIDNVDKMLQDQAQCQKLSSSNITIITATGTRTSASDAAVATLQQKGYTVSVTPA